MSALALFAAVGIAAVPVVSHFADPCLDLRERVAEAARDGVSAEELAALSAEGFALAEEAPTRSGFWNALGIVGELCAAGPHVEARRVRARALALLAQRNSDTMRWSSLVTERFLPAFGRIPREGWAAELASYDAVLAALVEAAASDRVRAELLYAQAFARVFINRRWDGLSAEDRSRTLDRLHALDDRFGTLAVPGAGDPATQTVGARARQHDYELTTLYFGAHAPPTSGVDLEGRTLDLADYAGRVVVLDFWTTFCQPCLALVPGVRDLMQELEGEPVVYVGVNGDTERGAGLATAKRVGMTWRNLWDGPLGTAGPAAVAWNVAALGWPSVFVIDRAGRIRFKLRGKEQVDAELEASIRALLAEDE